MTGFIETHVYLRGYSNYEKNYKFCHLPFFESQCLDSWDKPQQRGSGDDPSLNYKGPKKSEGVPAVSCGAKNYCF